MLLMLNLPHFAVEVAVSTRACLISDNSSAQMHSQQRYGPCPSTVMTAGVGLSLFVSPALI